MINKLNVFLLKARRGLLSRKDHLTALFLRLIGSVLAVLDGVTHLGAVDTLSVFAQKLQGSFTFGGCVRDDRSATTLKAPQHFNRTRCYRLIQYVVHQQASEAEPNVFGGSPND